jgi:hypothetical protein
MHCVNQTGRWIRYNATATNKEEAKSMFKQLMKNTLASLALGAGLLAFGTGAYAACVKLVDGSTGIQTEILYAGQTIEAGTISMEVVEILNENNNPEEHLSITYETTGGWQLQETHVWVGADLADMPQTRQGNPKIGNFPYQSGDITGQTTHTETVPLNLLGFSCPGDDKSYYVAAHAAVQLVDDGGNVMQTETGWSDGDRYVERGMWGTYSTTTLTCDCTITEPPVVGGGCETAFAYSGGTNATGDDITNSFLDIIAEGTEFNRWGWSNGTISAGIYTWDIYAGAGQSDITKGTLVGTLTVDYDNTLTGSALVTYAMDAPYYMEENHLYVGSEILPRDVNGEFTVAPGQYPSKHEELTGLDTSYSDSHVVTASGEVYVVAHATVCGFQD